MLRHGHPRASCIAWVGMQIVDYRYSVYSLTVRPRRRTPPVPTHQSTNALLPTCVPHVPGVGPSPATTPPADQDRSVPLGPTVHHIQRKQDLLLNGARTAGHVLPLSHVAPSGNGLTACPTPHTHPHLHRAGPRPPSRPICRPRALPPWAWRPCLVGLCRPQSGAAGGMGVM